MDHANLQPGDVFDALVLRNPEVCSNCFARCRDVLEGEYRSKGTGQLHPITDSVRVEEGIPAVDAVAHASTPMPTYHPSTACNECGSVGLRSLDTDSLTPGRAGHLARRAAERVQEAGVEIDVDAVLHHVGRAKSDPDLTGKDHEILREAIAQGLAPMTPPA